MLAARLVGLAVEDRHHIVGDDVRIFVQLIVPHLDSVQASRI